MTHQTDLMDHDTAITRYREQCGEWPRSKLQLEYFIKHGQRSEALSEADIIAGRPPLRPQYTSPDEIGPTVGRATDGSTTGTDAPGPLSSETNEPEGGQSA